MQKTNIFWVWNETNVINPFSTNGLQKTFWGTTKKCENKNFNLIFHFNITFRNARDIKG